jgi:putative addiction module killer protein
MLVFSMAIVSEYVTSDGRCPFAEWFDGLNAQAAAKVATAVERMRDDNFGDHKSVGAGVLERRVNFGPGYRIYFGREGDELVILLGGGTKSRQSRDVKKAQAMWDEYKATKKE